MTSDTLLSSLPKNTERVTSRLVMSAHLNGANSLFGGRLVQWVDEAAAIYAMDKLKTKRVVTKKISEILYSQPTRLNDVLDFYLAITRAGNTSINISCWVFDKAIQVDETPRLILNCDIVFVSIDENGKPTPHGLVLPDTF
jgi:acyl-CoA hydrolase